MLKQLLLNTGVVEDNIYLDKYLDIISNTSNIDGPTHRHHIIPRSYYKHLNIPIDNSDSNIAVLSIKNHVLAHYFLAKCSKETYFKLSNVWSVCYMLRLHKKLTLDKLEDCIRTADFTTMGTNNSMRVNSIKNKHDKIMRTDSVRKKISQTNKKHAEEGILFNFEHKQKLKESVKHRVSKTGCNVSKNGYIGGVTGLKMIYDTEGNRHYVSKEKITKLLQNGYTLPINKKSCDITTMPKTKQKHNYVRHISQQVLHNKLSKAHLGHTPANKGVPVTEHTKELIRQHFINTRWMNNGTIQKQVKQEYIEDYLKEGFVYGRIKKQKHSKGGDASCE